MGFTFQLKRNEIALVLIIIVLFFWLLDSVNKNFREDYKKRRDEVAAGLQKLFSKSYLPNDFVSPNLPLHNWIGAFQQALQLHVFLFYAILIIVAVVIFFVV